MKKLRTKEPTNIWYGLDFSRDIKSLILNNQYFGKNAILITGQKNFQSGPNYKVLLKSLKDSNVKIIKKIKTGPNPTLKSIEKFKKIGPSDIIICVGGGSVIDFGKALKKFYLRNSVIFAIYTFPGSASIVSPFTIFDNNEFKIGEYSPNITPDISYINEKILLAIPKNILRTATFDICSHIVESFLSTSATDSSKKYALIATKFLDKYTKSKHTDCFALINADINAGLSEKTGIVLFPHAAGHFLTYKFKVPHNVASMYFLSRFVERLSRKNILLPKNMKTMLNLSEKYFVKMYKRTLPIKQSHTENALMMITKYMPFVFKNNPVSLSDTEYKDLFCEYKKR